MTDLLQRDVRLPHMLQFVHRRGRRQGGNNDQRGGAASRYALAAKFRSEVWYQTCRSFNLRELFYVGKKAILNKNATKHNEGSFGKIHVFMVTMVRTSSCNA